MKKNAENDDEIHIKNLLVTHSEDFQKFVFDSFLFLKLGWILNHFTVIIQLKYVKISMCILSVKYALNPLFMQFIQEICI